MKIFYLRNYQVRNKTVLVRVDYNVPLEKGKVADNHKIKASLPTIKYLLQNNCKIILATHLGRPNGQIVHSLKVDPLVKELNKLLPKVKIIKVDDCIGKEIKENISKAKPRQIILLENLRFYKEEEKDNPFFAHSLADFADLYINDAFAVSHRKHASVHNITKYLPSVAGFLLEREIKQLSKALKPRKPAVWIMGGAKLNKIDLIKQALKRADYILIGGALAFSFLKAKGISVGMSKTDKDSVDVAKKILKKRSARKIILPLDFVTATTFSSNAKTKTVAYNRIENGEIALDMGVKSIDIFKHYLRKAHTIVWNGPLGYFEWAKFAKSTKEIGRLLGKLTATSICGGGETVEAIKKFHLQHNISHLSTGGGAALTFLSGKKLPGVEALEKNYKMFRKEMDKIRNQK
ncbi:MAG: phosphoglycerate kinase [Nanoarchaeota archaeon]|nr:phosphoglycerate kinase [Nanoarchaeota archaeon]MBU1631954.1 phosphoglycerate kinase [Nanoarchaeota archaeon]MBU1875515.1 phosphoglycerate kinase [Nanoarchaeota archaeon]